MSEVPQQGTGRITCAVCGDPLAEHDILNPCTSAAHRLAPVRPVSEEYLPDVRPEQNRGRTPAPHGTMAAYRRHIRHKEKPCQACKNAASAYMYGRRMSAKEEEAS